MKDLTAFLARDREVRVLLVAILFANRLTSCGPIPYPSRLIRRHDRAVSKLSRAASIPECLRLTEADQSKKNEAE